MPTLEELEKAFSVYFDEIERCRKAECYWALLHVVVALPDICAALESDDGRTSGAKYVSWCNRFPATEIMNGDDWWEVRCLVLHQGRTKTRDGRFYKFVRPNPAARAHQVVWGSRDTIALDVGEMSNDIAKSIRAWFQYLQGPYLEDVRAKVQKNLGSLVIVREAELPGISGITFTATHTSTG
jgi:hypothetical protein